MSTAIVVAGIGGNQLRFRPVAFLPEKTVWLCIPTLATGGWELLKLDDAGDGPSPSWLPAMRPAELIEWYYPILCGRLLQSGWRVIPGITDWRKPLAVSVQALVDTIRAESAFGPVTLICHSRGGLLAAAACNVLAGAGDLSRVYEGVSLGTPWAGSYEAVSYLGGWASVERDIGYVISAAATIITPLIALRTVRGVLATWPGIYELLPDLEKATSAGDANISNVYLSTLWSAAGVPVSDRHLQAARTRWTGHPGLPAGLKWTHIVSDSFGTRGPMTASTDFSRAGVCAMDLAGDGVVPYWSQTALGGALVKVGVDHNAMVQAKESVDAVLATVHRAA